MKHTAAVFYDDALQFVLVCYRTLAEAPKFSRSTQTSPQWPIKAAGGLVRTAESTSGTAGYRRATADRRDRAPHPQHAADASELRPDASETNT